MAPVMTLYFTLRIAEATAARIGALPPLVTSSSALMAMAVATYDSAAYGSGFLPNFFLYSAPNCLACGLEAAPAAVVSYVPTTVLPPLLTKSEEVMQSGPAYLHFQPFSPVCLTQGRPGSS